MAVEKAIELIGTGPTLQDAVAEAVDRAGLTIRGITSFEVEQIAGVVEEARITYRARVRVWFTVMEPVHG
jgi:flavin-binding protein dodecin